MESDKKMDVADWQDAPPPVILKNRAPQRFLSPTLIGTLGTLLLHTMVIESLPFGSREPKAKPPDTQESADALTRSQGDPAESLVLVTLATPVSSNRATIQYVLSSLPDLSKMKFKSPINVDPPALANPETLALSEDPTSKLASDSGDAAEQARFLGGSSLFDINANSFLRIGWGWSGSASEGTNVFRISGSFIDWLGVESGHIDLFYFTPK